jgi:phosphopantetheine adenylyltransferase
MAVSSTQVRSVLKSGGDAGAFVPARALEIILKRGFYR